MAISEMLYSSNSGNFGTLCFTKKIVWVALDFIGLALAGKDIVFRFIIEYSSLRDFGPYVLRLFLYEVFKKMIFWLVLKLEISYRVIIP